MKEYRKVIWSVGKICMGMHGKMYFVKNNSCVKLSKLNRHTAGEATEIENP